MSQRLVLVDIQLNPIDDGPDAPKEAYVVLSLRGQRFIGRYFPSQGQDDLYIIAAATLDAVQQALPVPVEFVLRSAIKLTPQFLDTPLMVVIADLLYGPNKYELTGACQCELRIINRGIAQATLDATNRLVQYILAEYAKKS